MRTQVTATTKRSFLENNGLTVLWKQNFFFLFLLPRQGKAAFISISPKVTWIEKKITNKTKNNKYNNETQHFIINKHKRVKLNYYLISVGFSSGQRTRLLQTWDTSRKCQETVVSSPQYTHGLNKEHHSPLKPTFFKTVGENLTIFKILRLIIADGLGWMWYNVI